MSNSQPVDFTVTLCAPAPRLAWPGDIGELRYIKAIFIGTSTKASKW